LSQENFRIVKRSLQFIISLACGGLVLFAVFRHFDLQKTLVAVRQANPALLMLGLGLMCVGYLVRGLRWRVWEHSLTYWDSLSLILIGFMGNNVLPARLGEVLRAHCSAPKIAADRGRTAALASIGAERILDGFVLAMIGLVGMLLAPVDHRLRISLFLVALAFALLACALIVSARWHELIRGWIDATNRMFPGHLTNFARVKANHFLDGFLPLGTFSRMAGALAMTASIWGIEIGFYFCVGRAVWPAMSLPVAILFLVVVNFASLIPLTIGGIGTIEAVALAFLTGAGIPPYPALAMILIQHGGQYIFTTVSGGIIYFARGFYRIPLASPKAEVAKKEVAIEAVPVLEETRSSLGKLKEDVQLRPAQRDEIELSLVIPAYNEQARLPRTVLETIRWGTSQHLNFELVIADDGSRDETLSLARLFEESDARVRALSCPHMGKGATVRMGVLNAKGRYVLFMDADGATPLTEIPKLLAAMETYDVAIGSRVIQQPGEVEVKTSALRKFVGRVFAFFVNLFAIEGIADTQCGFKMFRRDAALAVFSRQKTAGFAFDVEVLYLAKKLSLSITEIPVNWVAQAGSKVNLVADSIRMLWDISHIRWIHRNVKKTSLAIARTALAETDVVGRETLQA
jgi:dolichyl-phosphate beta-glucosyltransferase